MSIKLQAEKRAFRRNKSYIHQLQGTPPLLINNNLNQKPPCKV